MNPDEGWFRGHLRGIDPAECQDLLASLAAGRAAYCDEHGPVVLPVSYVIDSGDVILRISPHPSLATHPRSGPAAFQIDEFDDYTQSGWSVLVRGTATFGKDEDVPMFSRRPVMWVEGNPSPHVRITPSSITGHRLLAA